MTENERQAIENSAYYKLGAEILDKARKKAPLEKLEELAVKFPEYKEELSAWIAQRRSLIKGTKALDCLRPHGDTD